MKITPLILMTTLCCLAGCNRASSPASSGAASSTKPPDAAQQKLIEYAGAGATNCGRLDVHATADQSKTASDCAMQASQNKHAFYVAYDMPGMIVGVAGDSQGQLYTVQAQGPGSPQGLTSGACPSQLRVAASGRVSCFAPGDLSSMSGSHAAGAMPPGMPNPHTGGTNNPHSGGAKPKSGNP
jgi:hypothetical protein